MQVSDALITSVDVSERILAAAVNSALDSIIITDSQLDRPGPTIVHVNAAFTAMTGYAFGEAVGQSPRLLQGPKTDRGILDEIRRKLSNNEVFVGQAVNYRKDGSTFINEWHIEPVFIENVKTDYYLAIQRDVTERERLRQQLNDSHQALRTLLDQINIERQSVEDNIALNVNQLIFPVIERIKSCYCNNESLLEKVHLLEKYLYEISSSFGVSLMNKHANLSPRELQIADMIRFGDSTKDIARTLCLSSHTVEKQRGNLRRKLNLTGRGVNLKTYLQSFVK